MSGPGSPHSLDRRTVAGKIRAYLWQPIKPSSTDDSPWTMARELNIWATLARRVDPEALTGAIEHMRDVTGSRGPLSLRWFLSNPPLLARAVAAWESQRPCLGAPRGGGVSRISVEILPSPNEVTPS